MAKPDPSTTQRTILSDGPAPAAPRTACLVVIHGEGVGRRVDIDERPVLVGRSEEAELHFGHRSVSRRHCIVWRDGGDYRVRDLGATNATRVNEQVVAERALADGDHVTVGENVLKFISHTSIEAHYHEEIYQLATHDALTELCNRRHFLELMEKEIARAQRHARPLALCIVDVDLFKPVNDRYGHISGDGVLQRIAAVVREHVRQDDIGARIGGEEFAVLLPECGLDAAGGFAERVRAGVAALEFRLGDDVRRITVSIGVAALAPGQDSRPALMAAADAALYRAKHEGRNRVCLQAPQADPLGA
jgi:diguanylate cyclase (GGDEF)-like protein